MSNGLLKVKTQLISSKRGSLCYHVLPLVHKLFAFSLSQCHFFTQDRFCSINAKHAPDKQVQKTNKQTNKCSTYVIEEAHSSMQLNQLRATQSQTQTQLFSHAYAYPETSLFSNILHFNIVFEVLFFQRWDFENPDSSGWKRELVVGHVQHQLEEHHRDCWN